MRAFREAARPGPASARRGIVVFLLAFALAAPGASNAQRGSTQSGEDERLADATALLRDFTAADDSAIPGELLQRARGIAVIPNVLRAGFIFGGRRGRGVLTVRSESGEWSTPAFIKLTGGSFGGQIGVESTDLVLIFANDNAVKNMRSGKFTLGGDATAVAGPLGRTANVALTFRAEVYGYVRSRGLFAGAAFEGARLALDHETNAVYYGSGAVALETATGRAPAAAREFLQTVRTVSTGGAPPRRTQSAPRSETSDEARTFPLE